MTVIIHLLQIVLFLTALVAFSRRMFLSEYGYLPTNPTGLVPLRAYNVMPLLFLAVVVIGIAIGEDFSSFGEAILLAVTFAILIVVGFDDERDPVAKKLALLTAILSFVCLGLVAVRFFTGV